MNTQSKISLMVEGYPRYGFQTYSKLLGYGLQGLCISRLHPEYVTEKYGLQGTKCFWLSCQKGDDTLSPKSLHHIVKKVKNELKGSTGKVVMLDGLEYLLLWNDIAKVLSMLGQFDAALGDQAGLVIPVDPLTLERKDVERLWEAYPRFGPDELLNNIIGTRPQQISSIVPGNGRRTIGDLPGQARSHAMP